MTDKLSFRYTLLCKFGGISFLRRPSSSSPLLRNSSPPNGNLEVSSPFFDFAVVLFSIMAEMPFSRNDALLITSESGIRSSKVWETRGRLGKEQED